MTWVVRAAVAQIGKIVFQFRLAFDSCLITYCLITMKLGRRPLNQKCTKLAQQLGPVLAFALRLHVNKRSQGITKYGIAGGIGWPEICQDSGTQHGIKNVLNQKATPAGSILLVPGSHNINRLLE